MSNLPLNTDELAVIFGYRNRRGVNRAIRLHKFPIPTYVHEGQRYAHPEHVNTWLRRKKEEAEEEFQSIEDEKEWDV